MASAAVASRTDSAGGTPHPTPAQWASRAWTVQGREQGPVTGGRGSPTRLRAVNPDAHPIVAQIGQMADKRGIGRKPLARMAGLKSEATVQSWFLRNARPNVPSIDAVAAVFGHRLVAVRVGGVPWPIVGTKRHSGPVRQMRTGTHPLVRDLVRIADDFEVSLAQAADHAGVKYTTVKAWCAALENQPALDNLDAMFGALGYALRLVPVA